MAKLQRITGKVFGETASAVGDANVGPYIGQFGSAKLGTYYGTTDVAEIQNLAAWSNGFIDAVTPSNQYPTLPEMTGVCKNLSHQECYILQQGIPEYDASTEYYTNGFCSYNDEIYISLQDSNTGNQPNTSPTYWQKYSGRFLNYHQISNCILEAPNGVYSISGRTLTLKEGLKVLIADGRNADNTLKNIEYTLPSDVSLDYSIYSAGGSILVFLTNGGTGFPVTTSCLLGSYKYVTQLPSTVDTTASYLAYCDYNNYWYRTSGSTTANWQTVSVVPIVPLYFATSTTMSGASLYSLPIKLADTNMIDGRWVYSSHSLNTSTAYTTYTIDLSSVLPRDQFKYECLFRASLSRTDASNGNSYYYATINNVIVVKGMTDGGTSSGDNKEWTVQFTGIIDGNRSMSITLAATSGVPNLQGQETDLVAYRRIGANG